MEEDGNITGRLIPTTYKVSPVPGAIAANIFRQKWKNI